RREGEGAQRIHKAPCEGGGERDLPRGGLRERGARRARAGACRAQGGAHGGGGDRGRRGDAGRVGGRSATLRASATRRGASLALRFPIVPGGGRACVRRFSFPAWVVERIDRLGG